MIVLKIEFYAYLPNIWIFFHFELNKVGSGSGSDFIFSWAGSEEKIGS